MKKSDFYCFFSVLYDNIWNICLFLHLSLLAGGGELIELDVTTHSNLGFYYYMSNAWTTYTFYWFLVDLLNLSSSPKPGHIKVKLLHKCLIFVKIVINNLEFTHMMKTPVIFRWIKDNLMTIKYNCLNLSVNLNYLSSHGIFLYGK